jgi:hypothetical protein
MNPEESENVGMLLVDEIESAGGWTKDVAWVDPIDESTDTIEISAVGELTTAGVPSSAS